MDKTSYIRAKIPAYSPCKRRFVYRSRPLSTRMGVRDITKKYDPFWVEIPVGSLDPAAALLLPVLSNPGIRLYGTTSTGVMGELYVPVWYSASSRPVAQWINQHLADWRDGARGIPPIVTISAIWAWSDLLKIPLGPAFADALPPP